MEDRRSVALIRKVYEVDPLKCPKCGGRMTVMAFLTRASVIDRIIDHLKISFTAERAPFLIRKAHVGR